MVVVARGHLKLWGKGIPLYTGRPKSVESTPTAFSFSLSSHCLAVYADTIRTWTWKAKETKALVFCTKNQEGRPMGAVRCWGKSWWREKSGNQTHKVVHVLLGWPKNCACVNLTLNSIPQTLTTELQGRPLPRSWTGHWVAFPWYWS